MRVQVLSDVHLEFLQGKWQEWIDALDPSGVDVLVLAGDIAVGYWITPALKRFCAKYPAVIFVNGNHEMYGSSPSESKGHLDEARSACPNLHVLECSAVTLGGVRFVGTSLWFRDSPMNVSYQHMLNDFNLIRDFVPWVYDENRKAEAFLRSELSGPTPPDVVVTHHLPSQACVTPEYRGSPLNRFFVAPVVEDLVRDGVPLPKVWVFGHTHTPMRFTKSGCHFVCNATGYPHEPKRLFNPKLVLDIEPRPPA